MSDRREVSYNEVFSALKELVPSFQPRLILTDYEVALVKSLEENFPDANKTGCWFHYCQAVMRKAGNLGMKQLLTNNLPAKKALKFLLCLPLLPADKFTSGIEYITSFLAENNLQEQFQTLMSYHERQWLRRVGANSISVFNRTRRTNNDTESFHAFLQRILRVRGPDVWQFTDGLRNITATTVRELKGFVEQGLQITTLTKRNYRNASKRIRDAKAQFLINGEVVLAFLNMVCCSVETMVQVTIATEEVELADEQHLLGVLEGDVPPEYAEVGEFLRLSLPRLVN